MIPFRGNSRTGKTIGAESRSVTSCGSGRAVMIAKRQEGTSGGDGRVLKQIQWLQGCTFKSSVSPPLKMGGFSM